MSQIHSSHPQQQTSRPHPNPPTRQIKKPRRPVQQPVRNPPRRRVWRFLYVEDEYTGFMKWRVRNNQLCCLLASCQLVITAAALAQHIFSLVKYQKIFFCKFPPKTDPLPGTTTISNSSAFLAADIIIFDFGLFYRLMNKVDECIANHLDGGYLRFLWCLNQICTLVGLVGLQTLNNPHPWLFVPTLATETFYVMGMGVLTLATSQSLLKAIINYESMKDDIFLLRLFTYFFGMFSNVFFDYVLWHYYWFIEARYKRSHPNAAFL